MTARMAMLALLLAPPLWAAPDILVEDFEGADYGGWTVEGTAFGTAPAQGTLAGQMPVSGYHGHGLVNGYLGGDGSMGTLTSTPFQLERKYLHFLIGGGMNATDTCMELLVDGKVVRTATGPNDKPGGTERLAWHSWDVDEIRGQQAVLRITDRATGGWGHINIDYIAQSDEPTKETLMQFRAEKRYLCLPVRTGAPTARLQLLEAGAIVRDFEIELADAEPEFWTFLDLAPFAGKDLTLKLADGGLEADRLKAVLQGDEVPGMEDLYREPLRPQFHFTSRRGWNNDPNGLVHANGEYHLYYQHNPYGWNWGNMHWGHAVSRDLVHWTELPIAIYNREFGDWVFSGSATIDTANTSGFQQGAEPPIVAAYTSTGRGECIAYSNDRGRSFTDYEGNPVVKHSGRDPKIQWYAPGGWWVMAVYDERGESQGIAFYTSPDLKTWEFQSRVEGYFECPELCPIALDGDAAKTKWVLYAASGEYAVGGFDGKTFTPETEKLHYHSGNCFYASQTYSNIPAEDGRRIQIAWGTMATPGMPFNQMMDFPVELTLHSTPEGPRLFTVPVREIASLHAREHHATDVALGYDNPLAAASGELFHVRATLEPGKARELCLYVRGIPVTYDVGRQVLRCLTTEAPLPLIDGRIELEMLVDRTSIEIFGNGGRLYMPMGILLAPDVRSLSLVARGEGAVARSLTVWELKSAWE
jgi:fructan beta-fructosidase